MAAARFPEAVKETLERAGEILQKEGLLPLLRAGLRKPLRWLGVLPGGMELERVLAGLDETITPACVGQAVFVCSAERSQTFETAEGQLRSKGWLVVEVAPESAAQVHLEPGAAVWWVDGASCQVMRPAIEKRPGWQRIWVGLESPGIAVEGTLAEMPCGDDLDGWLRKLFPLVSLLMVTYNNLQVTRLCLKSILENTIYPFYEIVVVDNASADGTPDYLSRAAEQEERLGVILNPENLGFSGGNNKALERMQGKFAVFINNDIVTPPGWLVGLLAHLDNPQVGMVGPRTNYWGNQSRLEVKYRSLAEFDAFARQRQREFSGQAFEIPSLALYCLAMPRKVVDEIGLLDERFGIGMFEDDDYCHRARLAGYKLLCAEDVLVHHWGKQSFSRLGREKNEQLFDENRRKFEEKWQMEWQPPKQG